MGHDYYWSEGHFPGRLIYGKNEASADVRQLDHCAGLCHCSHSDKTSTPAFLSSPADPICGWSVYSGPVSAPRTELETPYSLSPSFISTINLWISLLQLSSSQFALILDFYKQPLYYLVCCMSIYFAPIYPKNDQIIFLSH